MILIYQNSFSQIDFNKIGEATRRSKIDMGTEYLHAINNNNLLGDVTVGLGGAE